MIQHTLVVDDDPVVLFLMKKLIEHSGFDGGTAYYERARIALEELENSYSTGSRYVIFLDINMPEMNGWQFLDNLNRFASPDNTDVFIITSSTDSADKNKADSFRHVKRFLSKPVRLEQLVEIREALK